MSFRTGKFMEWGALFLVTLFRQVKRVTGSLKENPKGVSMFEKASQELRQIKPQNKTYQACHVAMNTM